MDVLSEIKISYLKERPKSEMIKIVLVKMTCAKSVSKVYLKNLKFR